MPAFCKTDTFRVCEYISGGICVVKNGLTAQQAGESFMVSIQKPAATLGIIERVVIIDDDDCINAEWIHGQGLVFA